MEINRNLQKPAQPRQPSPGWLAGWAGTIEKFLKTLKSMKCKGNPLKSMEILGFPFNSIDFNGNL